LKRQLCTPFEEAKLETLSVYKSQLWLNFLEVFFSFELSRTFRESPLFVFFIQISRDFFANFNGS